MTEREEKWPEGPWRIDYDGVLCAPANQEINRRYDIHLASFKWSSFREFNEPQNKAVATLLKSAPALYEALVLILPLAKGYSAQPKSDTARETNRKWIAVAEAALSQAHGETGEEG